MSAVCNDMATLIPAFRRKVETLMQMMRDRGWNPYVFETRRTKERAAELHARGTGSKDSMHIYDVAVDIVDADLHNVPKKTREGYWDAPAKFWADLEDCAVTIGLHRLYRAGVKHDVHDDVAQSWDKPHVQACSLADQNKLRRMTRDERAAYLQLKFDSALAAIDDALKE